MQQLFTKFTALAGAVLLFSGLNAQTTRPDDGTIRYEKATRPALVIHLDPETKPLKEAWTDYLKDQYDVKLKGFGFLSNKDVLYKEGISFPAISDKKIDFYTEIIQDETGSKMSVFATHGYDSYLSPTDYSDEYANMRKIFEDFLKSYVPNYYKDMVENTQEVVDDLSKDREKLSKDIEKNNRKIQKMSEDLEELKQEVEEDKSTLQQTDEKLQGRQEKLKVLQLKLKNVETSPN